MDEAPDKFDMLVEQWVSDHFRGGSPIARNTECWNCMHDAAVELKKRLKAAKT
jgi:hypothetical protein